MFKVDETGTVGGKKKAVRPDNNDEWFSIYATS